MLLLTHAGQQRRSARGGLSAPASLYASSLMRWSKRGWQVNLRRGRDGFVTILRTRAGGAVLRLPSPKSTAATR
jgi:hypothetical protein